MLNLYIRKANHEGNLETDLDDFVASLGEAFRPVLAGAVNVQAKALGVDPRSLGSMGPNDGANLMLFSELIGVSGGIICLQVHRSRRGFIMGSSGPEPALPEKRQITLFGFGPEEVVKDLDNLAALMGERYSLDFAPFRYESTRFNELKDEGMAPPPAPSKDEISAARLLADNPIRVAARAIAASGGLLVGDLPKQLESKDRERSAEIIKDLEAVGLVSSDVVVICSRTAEQVLRVPSLDALKKAGDAEVQCACGADVLDERTEFALSLTGFGRKMLDGSWWMTVLLMEELARLGIERDCMLVEQTDGGDEVDCFADISGALAIFELKDKEFSLGNAYSFGSKFGIYRSEYSVVVTTASVGNDAKEHFKKAISAQRSDPYAASGENTTSIQYIEGLGNLRGGLEELVGGILQGDAAMLLRMSLPAAALDAGTLVDALVDSQGIDFKDVERREAREEAN